MRRFTSKGEPGGKIMTVGEADGRIVLSNSVDYDGLRCGEGYVNDRA